VFDIDGTLTPHPVEVWKVRPNAAKVIQLYSDKGYKIIYLSARLPVKVLTSTWLKKKGLSEGIGCFSETVLMDDQVEEFKISKLKTFKDMGWQLSFAYGDSSTDFAAYAAASIPSTNVFALRRKGESSCQLGAWKMCLSEWDEEEHIKFVTDLPEQPKTRR
jgi:phosphatidate phosphatase PAH1